MSKRIIVLGSTGSIGTNTLEVARNLSGELVLSALAAGSNWQALLEQAREFRPAAVGLGDEAAAAAFRSAYREAPWQPEPRIYSGSSGLVSMVRETDADIVLGAISGAAGLPAVLAGLESGKDLALANKEALVMAGNIVMRRARELDRRILPVDSEHSAIFQAMRAGRAPEVRRIILTASGGPFRQTPKSELAAVTPEMALKHPTWEMGAKITIDSATLMNKALEIIEAYWLFGLSPEQIEVVIHPQSIVHSFVEYVDGSTICQLGPPDMKVPIQYALTFPDRRELAEAKIDLVEIGSLTFEAPDHDRFPSLGLAYDSLRKGGTAPAVLNAANEVAVELFLKGKLEFLRIFEVLGSILGSHVPQAEPNLEAIYEADRWARDEVRKRS